MGADDEVGGRLSPETDHSPSLAERTLCRYTPEVGAVCGKVARPDLCGGREGTRVPTETSVTKRGYGPPGEETPWRSGRNRAPASSRRNGGRSRCWPLARTGAAPSLKCA